MFYAFVSHLAVMMLLTIVLSIMNVFVHFYETKEDHLEEEIFRSNGDIWKLTCQKYWGSIAIAFYALLFGVFVFGLCGFHTWIISLNLSTYEKLKK